MQIVHWQIKNPRERKLAYWAVCGVKLAARPTKTSPSLWNIFVFQNNIAFRFAAKIASSTATFYGQAQSLHEPKGLTMVSCCFS